MSLTQDRINHLVGLHHDLLMLDHVSKYGPRTTPIDMRFENKSSATTEIYLYDDIGPWGITSRDFVGELNKIPQDHVIDLHVNSGGGSVFEGMAIYNALKRRKPRMGYVDGVAASAASFITMAASEVVMPDASSMMIHGAQGLTLGTAQDHRDTAELLDMITAQIADIYATKSGTPADQWLALMKSDKWYTAQAAVDAKLADRVASDVAPVAKLDLSGLLNLFDQPADTVCPQHKTATSEDSWDASVHEKRLPSPMPLATAKKFYAWYDGSRVDNGMVPKDAGKLPHHLVNADGTPGAADLPAVRNALARLSNTDIPANEKDAVRAHLRAHLDAAQNASAVHVSAHEFDLVGLRDALKGVFQ